MTKQLLTILTVILFISCSKKDDEVKDTTKENLLGDWNITKVYSKEGKVKAAFEGIPIPIEAELILTGSDYNMEVSFKKNTISSSGSFKLNTTIKAAAIQNSLLPKIPPVEVSNLPGTTGTWDVKEEKLINKTETEETSVNIVSYNTDKIVFSYPISQYIDNETIQKFEPKPKDVKVTGHLFIELTK